MCVRVRLKRKTFPNWSVYLKAKCIHHHHHHYHWSLIQIWIRHDLNTCCCYGCNNNFSSWWPLPSSNIRIKSGYTNTLIHPHTWIQWVEQTTKKRKKSINISRSHEIIRSNSKKMTLRDISPMMTMMIIRLNFHLLKNKNSHKL